MRALTIQLLGGLQVRSAAGRDIRMPSRKASALLACLALQPGVALRRDFLASLLWDDADPEQARASLRQALAALRRALAEADATVLVGDSSTVGLDAAAVTTDVGQCAALLREGTPESLAVAVERHGGALLDGFDARSSHFAEWIEERRRELRRDLLRAMERAAAHCAASADHAGAIRVLERLVALEPTHERAQRELMEGLARVGRHTDALRQYRELRDALRHHLDVSPEPATDALYRDILRRRQARDPAVDVPAAGPPAPAAVGPRAPAVELVTLREVVVLALRVEPVSSLARSDPELARDFWAALQAAFRAIVTRYGGRPSEASGPSMPLAVFGLEALTGLEAGRAVRAALELAATTDADDHRHERRIAVGITRGLVLPASSAQPFPLAGGAVPEAEALARRAEPGAVLVSADIALELGDRHDMEVPAEAAADGALYVRGSRNAMQPATGSRLVGRGPELALLKALLDRVVAAQRGRVARVRGEPGIGKSSLLAALAEHACRTGFVVHTVVALDFGQAARERPVQALAARLLGLSTDASDAAVRRQLQVAVDAQRLGAGDVLAAIDLLGVAPTAEEASLLSALNGLVRERGRSQLLSALVTRAAGEQPLLIVVEDTHWAGPVQNALLADLAAAAATVPVLLVLSTRSDDDPLGPAWRARARGCPITTLDLAPLDEDEARELAARYTGLDAAIVEHCLQVAAGHPFYLDQLLRAARAGPFALPGSVRSLLLARVERLAPAARRVLQAATVLGMRFQRDALRHALADPICDCDALQQEGLLAIDGEEIALAHALIRTVVYESLLRSHRHELHRRAASWFAGRDPVLHADHLAGADDPGAAAAYLHAAGLELSACRLDRALLCVERAREIAVDAHLQCLSCTMIGEVCLARGQTDEAVGAFHAAIDLATSPADRSRAWLGLAATLRVVDRYDEALDALRQAELAASAEADPRRLASLWTLRGNLHFPRGELDACLDAHQRALEFATRGGAPEDLARALGGLGDAQYQRGRIRTALEHFRHCVELCDQHGLAGPRLAYLPMLATARIYTGDFADAAAIAEQTATAARRVGEAKAELLALGVQAAIGVYRAQYAEALELASRSLAAARRLGARRFESESLLVTGLAWLGSGRREQALEALEDAVGLARVAAPTYCGPWALAALALATHDGRRARHLLQEGEELLERGCVSHNHFEFRHYAIEVGLREGDPGAVRHHAAALAAYARDEPLAWVDLVVTRARLLAAVVEGSAPPPHELRAVREDVRRMQFDSLLPALDRALDGRP